MAQNRNAKYVINADLAGSKLHLNPFHFDDMWCNLNQEHVLSLGDKIYVNNAEAKLYLEGIKSIELEGIPFPKPTVCINCSKRCKQSKYWDI